MSSSSSRFLFKPVLLANADSVPPIEEARSLSRPDDANGRASGANPRERL